MIPTSLRTPAVLAAVLALAVCAPVPASSVAPPPAPAPPRLEEVRRALFDLADDSTQGRRTGTDAAVRAAIYLAARLREAGARPGAPFGYFQAVPLAADPGDPTGRRVRLVPADEAARLPDGQFRQAFNVVARIDGSDPSLAGEAIVVGAHYDHLGVDSGLGGDSVYNGADDDASGTVAVLEIARALAANPPKRTVILFLATGEEQGMLGTRWYLDHPAVPLDSTVAGLFVEMIGRPDSLAGGAGRLWMTGFERSTAGPMLAAAGIPVVPDPRPGQGFFLRSDNAPFARRGIPAHVVSSFPLHGDYHKPSDEAERVDFAHFAAAVDAAVRAARVLADGPRPTWTEGGRP